MSGPSAEKLVPPGDLRPAQLGLILVGRVIAGHLGATLVDLCQRGFLRIEEIPGRDAQWLLTDLRGQAPGPGAPPLPFEAALLDGLLGEQGQARLPGTDTDLLLVLDRVREELRRDAVRHGWLRRWRQDRRTRQGEQLLGQIQAFRRELRALTLSGAQVPAALAPYMMIFGLAPAPEVYAGIREPAVEGSSEISWVRRGGFIVAWNAWVGESCGHHGNRRPDDFTGQWNVPNGHHHTNPGHHAGYGGHGGHGSFGGALGGHGVGHGGHS